MPILLHPGVFCGHVDPHFSYIFVENDAARRTDHCQACGRCCQSIVISPLTHALELPMEEFVTVNLDALLARQDIFE